MPSAANPRHNTDASRASSWTTRILTARRFPRRSLVDRIRRRVWLLVESVEGLVENLRAWALAGVLVGALVLGFDVESTAAGVAATLDNLPGTALGTSIGAAIFLLTVGLGVAALIAPFTIRPPAAMLGTTGVATALSIALCADGRLSRLDGGILLGAFVPLVAVIVLGRPRIRDPSRRALRPTYPSRSQGARRAARTPARR